jgi:putative ATPase
MNRKRASPTGPSLFDRAARRDPAAMPLAERVRPTRLHEVVGHRELVGPGQPLAEAIEADRLPSIMLWGPPGCGKTTLARVIAESTAAHFVPFSAVLGGVAEVRRIVGEAADRRRMGGGATILFVDEIHRFNKSQQDAFLPHVENGTVTLVGATTENPSFAINAPLLSRCSVYRLEPLADREVVQVLTRAHAHGDGLVGDVDVDEEAFEAIAVIARGDARRALGLLETAVEQGRRGGKRVTLEAIEALRTHETLLYDKAGEEHFNVVSAFIKSMRGTDPDGAIYWMMRMIEAGDDPLYVLRRMIIFAGEDIGAADPRALQMAVSADQAFRRLGLPEGLYPMASATIYLACAPKSNAATVAWHRARSAIRDMGALPVPKELRNATTGLMKEMGYGAGYRYAHDEADGFARGANYLPEALAGTRFYEPTDRGLEKRIGERLRWLRGEVEPETE